MNTSFKPSEFDKQAAASLDMMDEETARKRVEKILHPENPYPRPAQVIYSAEAKEAGWKDSAGPTLTPKEKKVVQQLGANPSEVDRVDVYRKLPDGTLLPIEGGVDLIATAPKKRIRRTRSDKGTHKPKAPADPDEIVLRLTLDEARKTALGMPDYATSLKIQDQIVSCLQKRLDALQKAK